ncbi:MAG TPA: DUF4159 domain-containing protein [Tepidisphaeraceae bacterium]|jgi:hypothetical protein
MATPSVEQPRARAKPPAAKPPAAPKDPAASARIARAQWLLCIPLAVMALLCALFALRMKHYVGVLIDNIPAIEKPFDENSTFALFRWLRLAVAAGAILFAATAALGLLLRRNWVLILIRIAYFAAYAVLSFWIFTVITAANVIVDTGVEIYGDTLNDLQALGVKTHYNWPAAALMAALMVFHALSFRRSTNALYERHEYHPSVESATLEKVDPIYRQSFWVSLAVHAVVILILPWMFQVRGCATQVFEVPGIGGGGSAGGGPKKGHEVDVVAKIKKQPKKPAKFVLNANSPISFKFPTMEQSEIREVTEKETENTFQVDLSNMDQFDENATEGASGMSGEGEGSGIGGKKGKGSGWGYGNANAELRFIRLEYEGNGWDDGKNEGADRNFLAALKKVSKFKARPDGESMPIGALRTYKKGYQPPMLYMTGRGAINTTTTDNRTIRDYLQAGGMLFVDGGGSGFDQSFRQWIKQVIPDDSLTDIANDDPIFQAPFRFPNGVPQLWHLNGRADSRAIGIRYQGRWCVFYAPGGIKDAWREGHSGASPLVQKQSFQIGINIFVYAYNHYEEATRQYHKAPK